MSGIEVRIDSAGLGAMAKLFADAGRNAPSGLARVINRTGEKARTQMIRVLVPQTGLKRATLARALRATRAVAGGLNYTIRSKGGDIHLKFFAARETGKGVSAAPWGRRQLYRGSFIKGGRFPNRVDIGKGGQVFVRTGSGRLPIASLRSGLFIPQEMVRGASEAAFHSVVEAELPGQLMRELGRLILGQGG